MILITGATGHIGRGVAISLSQRGTPLRLMARNPDRLPTVPAQRVKASYEDVESLARAFEDIDKAFVVSGNARPGERANLHRNAFEAAAQAGVRHVVYLSFLSASPASLFPMGRDHFLSEEYLEATGLPHTILRDSFYLDLIPDMFNEQAIMRGPGGQGRVSWVAREDVIRTIVSVLQNPGNWEGMFDITGPEALTLDETANQVSELTGREFRYENESLEEGRAWRSLLGVPDWEVDTWLGSYEAIGAGELGRVSDCVLRISGEPATTLRSYFSLYPGLLQRTG